MPVTNLYATADDLARRAPSLATRDDAGALTAEAVDQLEQLLEAISRAIDTKTRREAGAFSPAPADPVERVVYGNGKSCLEVPVHIAGTVNTTATAPTGYQAPKFVEHRGQLCITNEAGVLSRVSRWIDGVPYTISARWGYDSTPADIREACLAWSQLRARLNAGDISGVVTAITRGGDTLMRDELPPSIKDLLAPYTLAERENEDDRVGLVETGDIASTDDHPLDPFKRYF